jgi:hypothetical protein
MHTIYSILLPFLLIYSILASHRRLAANLLKRRAIADDLHASALMRCYLLIAREATADEHAMR